MDEIASICKSNDIFHLINNAYGLQSGKITHMINQVSGFRERCNTVPKFRHLFDKKNLIIFFLTKASKNGRVCLKDIIFLLIRLLHDQM